MLSRFGLILLISGILTLGFAESGSWKKFWNDTKVAYDKAKETCPKVRKGAEDMWEGFKQANDKLGPPGIRKLRNPYIEERLRKER